MSKKKQSDEGAPSKPGKGKSIGLAALALVAGAVVGPKLLGGGAAGGSEAPTSTTAPEGPIVVLDAVTLNLSDGRLLQVGLALELDPEHETGGGGHGEVDKDDPTKGYAKALDTAIDVLGGDSMAELGAPGGREAAKAALEERLAEESHGEIVGVYFHQFVMQ